MWGGHDPSLEYVRPRTGCIRKSVNCTVRKMPTQNTQKEIAFVYRNFLLIYKYAVY